ADIAAVRGEEDPVIGDLKTGSSLTLVQQVIQRQAMTDAVYIAVPRGKGRPFLSALKKNSKLCRRLGLGLITVRMKDGFTEIHLDPKPYQPRQSKRRKERLLREFAKRVGDPNSGGAQRKGLMTAYRQDALRCVHMLHGAGETKAAHVALGTGVEKARNIMADNHYGWFERVRIGIYALSPKGAQAIIDYAEELENLTKEKMEKI
ncbi:MAG: DUF2161 family putative PD-(D/E)XK-type phosphodiesterase, partial [Hyphomicrobiales bacterium]